MIAPAGDDPPRRPHPGARARTLVDEGTHDELADRCEDYGGFLMTEARREHLRDAFGAPAVAAGD